MLYNPPRFQNKDEARVHALMDSYPLATLISVEDGAPVISHVPLVRDGSRLVGHLARANPHWKWLGGRSVTAVFHGPQAYITPRWYVQNDVPTWSYAVVHVEGEARLIEDFAGIESCLRQLTERVEKGVENPWEYWLPEDLASPEKVVRSIVGFEIEVRSVSAKFKFLGSRSKEDQERVIQALQEERGDSVSVELARLMSEAR